MQRFSGPRRATSAESGWVACLRRKAVSLSVVDDVGTIRDGRACWSATGTCGSIDNAVPQIEAQLLANDIPVGLIDRAVLVDIRRVINSCYAGAVS